MEISVKVKVNYARGQDAKKETYKALFSNCKDGEGCDGPSHVDDVELAGLMISRILDVLPVSRRLCVLAIAVSAISELEPPVNDNFNEKTFCNAAEEMLALWKNLDEKCARLIEERLNAQANPPHDSAASFQVLPQ